VGTAREAFLKVARGERSVVALPSPTDLPVAPAEAPLPPSPPPAYLTSFVGREREVAQVADLLATTRLLTLTGPGGVGKTRLAVAAATAVRRDYADGIWFVDLAPLGDPALVLPTIARAFDVAERPDQRPAARLRAALAGRELLLVLDNCEQVLAAGPEVAALLGGAPRLRVLATSRERLRLAGERVFAVAPLAVPDPARPPVAPELAAVAAVDLFVQRARLVRHDFALTSENAAAVAEICARLEGLPLALELAAAWSAVLAPDALLKRLDRRLALLTRGPLDLPARQRAMRATIDWSYDLLGPDERALFRRMAVFVGGCALQDAEAVTDATGVGTDLLTGLAALVDKSLLRQEAGADGEPRFGMLEMLREYGLERLEGDGEAELVQGRHAARFRALAEAADRELAGPRGEDWLARLEAEHNNLRAALEWAIERGEAELGLRLGAALWRFWQVRGHFTEGRRWLGRILTDRARELAALCGPALTGAGALAWKQRDYASAHALLDDGIAACRESGDRRTLATALKFQGLVALYQREPDHGQATLRFEESLELRRALGDRDGVASCLNDLAIVALEQGDYGHASRFLEESLCLCRESGHRYGLTFVLTNLGLTSLGRGDSGRAAGWLKESLVLSRSLENREGISCALAGLACVAAAQRSAGRAARLFGAAEASREACGIPSSSAELAVYERHLAAARAQVGAAAWAMAMAEGRAAPLDRICAEALQD
jgi:non-specific serine/threonine protein kinase